MTGRSIDLVCFDIGNVLIELSSGWPQACAEARVALPGTADDPAVLGKLETLSREHECGRIDAGTFDVRAADCTGLSPREIDAVSRAWVRFPFSGAAELLKMVGRTDTTTACLSNTNDRHWGMFHGTARNRSALPMHCLDHHIASHRIGAMKPDERTFQHVERVTAVQTSRILFFDDNAENCAAAEQRGWCVLQIDPRSDPALQMRAKLEEVRVL